MIHQRIRNLVLAAVFAALCAVMSLVIQIPSPMQGYINLGDCAVLLSGWILGPIFGAAAAGLGSMLADILAGYAHYAPATLMIKALMAVLAGLLAPLRKKRCTFPSRLLSAAVSESVMVLGYFGYTGLLLGHGLGAAASIPGNLVQGVFSIAAALAAYHLLARSRAFDPLL